MSEKVGLSAPWITFYRKMVALFENDPEVRVIFDQENFLIKVYVDNYAKADALEQLLPTEKIFGNIKVIIEICPSNEAVSKVSLFRNAFAENPAVSSIETLEDANVPAYNYVIFKNKVVQFFNNDLTDYFGFESTLFEDIARDIFEDRADGVFFCTDLPSKDEE